VIRVAYPRNSWLDLLPRVFARDPDAARFLEHYLALFEHLFTRIGDRRTTFFRQLSAASAPPDVLAWLGCLLDLVTDPAWPLARRRALVGSAVELYRVRGTVEGVVRFVEAYTGWRPVIREEFLNRPARPAVLGGRGSLLGCGFTLRPTIPDTRPADELYAAFAHRFTVFAYLAGSCEVSSALAAVDRIVRVNKPAHTVHVVRAVLPGARVGLETNLGIDFVLDDRRSPAAEVGSAGGLVLGGPGAVLGNRRPGSDRPPGLQL
jgi:phage tail-like protein